MRCHHKYERTGHESAGPTTGQEFHHSAELAAAQHRCPGLVAGRPHGAWDQPVRENGCHCPP